MRTFWRVIRSQQNQSLGLGFCPQEPAASSDTSSPIQVDYPASPVLSSEESAYMDIEPEPRAEEAVNSSDEADVDPNIMATRRVGIFGEPGAGKSKLTGILLKRSLLHSNSPIAHTLYPEVHAEEPSVNGETPLEVMDTAGVNDGMRSNLAIIQELNDFIMKHFVHTHVILLVVNIQNPRFGSLLEMLLRTIALMYRDCPLFYEKNFGVVFTRCFPDHFNRRRSEEMCKEQLIRVCGDVPEIRAFHHFFFVDLRDEYMPIHPLTQLELQRLQDFISLADWPIKASAITLSPGMVCRTDFELAFDPVIMENKESKNTMSSCPLMPSAPQMGLAMMGSGVIGVAGIALLHNPMTLIPIMTIGFGILCGGSFFACEARSKEKKGQENGRKRRTKKRAVRTTIEGEQKVGEWEEGPMIPS